MYGIDFTAVKPVEAVRQTTVPVFIIHGGQDDMVPVEQAYKLIEASQNPDSKLWIVPEAGHSSPYLARPEEYMDKILPFFDDALA